MDSLLPFLQGTCTPYNLPVYPGALRDAGYLFKWIAAGIVGHGRLTIA